MKFLAIFLKTLLKGGKACGSLFLDMGKLVKAIYNVVCSALGLK